MLTKLKNNDYPNIIPCIFIYIQWIVHENSKLLTRFFPDSFLSVVFREALNRHSKDYTQNCLMFLYLKIDFKLPVWHIIYFFNKKRKIKGKSLFFFHGKNDKKSIVTIRRRKKALANNSIHDFCIMQSISKISTKYCITLLHTYPYPFICRVHCGFFLLLSLSFWQKKFPFWIDYLFTR